MKISCARWTFGVRSGTLACEADTLNQISRPLFQKITPCRKRKGWAWKTKDCLQIHADEAQGRAESNACLGMNCKDSQLARAAIAQLAARRSHNPKVVSSILTRRIFGMTPNCNICGLQEWHSKRKSSLQRQKMTLAGLEPAIFGSKDQRLIH